MPHADTLTDPNPARAYGFLLGSKDNFQADRDAIKALEDAYGPPGSEARGLPRLIAAQNREFLARAVTWAAEQGIGQFIDLGAGLPVPQPHANIHEAAREVIPGARVAYVDNDPTVIRHGRLQAAGAGLRYALADLTDAAAVWRHPEVATVIDLDQPAAVVFGMALHYFSAEAAREIVRDYAARLLPGSILIVSTPRWARRELWRRVREHYPLVELRNHSRSDLAQILSGLDLVPPGIVTGHCWRPGWQDCPTAGGLAYVLSGVARV